MFSVHDSTQGGCHFLYCPGIRQDEGRCDNLNCWFYVPSLGKQISTEVLRNHEQIIHLFLRCGAVSKASGGFWFFPPVFSLFSCPVTVIPSSAWGTLADEMIHWVGGLKGVPLGFIAGFGQPGANNASSVRLRPWQWAYVVGSPVSVPPGEIPSTCNVQTLPEGHP